MEAQKDTLSPDTLAAIQWLGMPEDPVSTGRIEGPIGTVPAS